MKTKTELQERCECGHVKLLHGNGSEAHGLTTCCITAGCECATFVTVPVFREPRAPKVKTLDRTEQRLFVGSDIGLSDE